MDEWKLQSETVHWHHFQSATALFIASVFGHPSIVRWLLERGADRDVPCYVGQSAVDLVGLFAQDERATDSCRFLLMEEPRAPEAPGAFDLVQHQSSALQATKSKAKVIEQKTVYHSTVQITWATPLSNGSMVRDYELRYRPSLVDASTTLDDKSWQIETATHRWMESRQGMTLENLTTGTKYQFVVRSRSDVGYGKWGTIEYFTTPSSPKDQAENMNHHNV